MTQNHDVKSNPEDENIFLKFLKRTKEGCFAPIAESSLEYIRLSEETESTINLEEEYYYSIS